MALGRENIYSALFALLTPLGPDGPGSPPMFNTVSRRLIPNSQLTPESQPALFMIESAENYQQEHIKMPPVVTLYADLWIAQFFSSALGPESAVPATVINNLMDSLEDSLLAPAGIGVQTLGGLVQNAWIEGRASQYLPTSNGQQAISVVRVAMLVNY